MFFDFRWLLILGLNVLLLIGYGLLNDVLAPLSVYLILLGPSLVVPAFFLEARSSVICALVVGLLWGCAHSGTLGLSVPLALGVNALVWLNRFRSRYERRYTVVLYSFFANLIWLVCLAVAFSKPEAGYWGRVFLDGLFSQLAVVPVALWAYALHEVLLYYTRMGSFSRTYSR